MVTKFAGNKDTYGFLSNMYNMTPVAFGMPVWLGPAIHRRIVVKCAEQSIQLMKAWWAQDLTKFEQLIQVNNGYDARKLGQQVQNLDTVGWNKVVCAVCYHAITHKFSTNIELKRLLIDTSDSVLAECFAWSKEWGIGYNADDTRSNHPHKFPGDGMLGAVQMLVREECGGKLMSYKTKLCHLDNTHGQNIIMPMNNHLSTELESQSNCMEDGKNEQRGVFTTKSVAMEQSDQFLDNLHPKDRTAQYTKPPRHRDVDYNRRGGIEVTYWPAKQIAQHNKGVHRSEARYKERY